ncbi:hypothetical protein PVAND_007698 [Polypedilum vanderplanki]|uniref:Ionotropic receptor 75a N-terminal domain-containing protein n=1 Tax=Polypedilum vanderplanki TaxID=319348 RepID=A0A9J6C7H0_POLVA|nr:hypothetical protein PVAND_007698 [Polypedilum vanderplanki]
MVTLGNDKIDNNLAESFRAYTETHKLIKIMELFSCESSMNQFLSIAKFLMPKGFYCNINIIDERSNIEMRLSTIKNKHPVRRTMMIVDTTCLSGGNLLKMASMMEMLNGHYHWILVEAFAQQHKSIIELLSVLNISISSEITLFRIQQQQQPSLLLLLYDVWNPSYHHGGQLIVTELGNYTNANGLQYHEHFRKQVSAGVIKRRMNMQGIKLKVMCVIQEELREPFEQLLYESYEPWRDPITRFSFSLLEIIREMFNLTYTLEHTKSWGYLQDDGSIVDGMIGALRRKEVDVGGSALFFRVERLQYISLTAESWNHRTCFIFQQPDYSATIQNPFLKPLDVDVWIILGIFGLVFAFTLNLVEGLHRCVKQMKVKQHNITHKKQIINQSHKSQHHNIKKHRNVIEQNMNVVKCGKSRCNDTKRKKQKAKKRIISLCLSQNQQSKNFYAAAVRVFNHLFNGLLIFIGALSLQGLSMTNRTSPAAMKITVYIMMMFGFLIYQFYSGSIVSSVFDSKHESIKTLEDLSNSNLELGLEDVVYDRDIFKHSKDPVLKRLYHKKIEFYNKTTRSLDYKFYTPEYGMEMVRTKAFAFHIQEAAAYKIIRQTFDEKLICKLSEINTYRPQVLVGGLQKNSTFRELFAYGTRRLKEVGLMNRWRQIFRLPKPKCARNLQASDFQVDITAIYPLLILLSAGFSLGLMVLIVEFWVFHRAKSQKPQRKLKQTEFMYLE